MKRKDVPEMEHGDAIRVHWLDIMGDVTGRPAEAALAECRTLGHFHEWKGRGKSRALVTCLTQFPKEPGECRGSDIYPIGCIERIEVIQKGEHSGPGPDPETVA